MRLAIDMQGAQTAGSSSRGIGRYTKALTQAIVRNRGEHDIFIALSGLFPNTIEPIRAAFDDLLPQENIRVWQVPGPVYWTDRQNDSRRRCAELIREAFLADLRPDVTLVSSLFEGLGDEAVTSVGALNRSQTTTAMLFDLIPLIHRRPYLEDPVVCAWYENKLDHLRRADLLLAISEATRQDGIGLLGFPAESCVNISTAADPQFRTIRIDSGREQEIRRRLGIERPFVMYTGGIDHRKNVEGLIRAYASLSRQLRAAHQLVIVCSVRDHDRSKLTFLAKQQNLSKSELVLTGFLPEDDLVALYNLCKVFVFPSWHEGFGLPALEAMSCGAPTLGSNCTSIPEVIGRDDALFDPRSDFSITEKLKQVLTDDAFRAELKHYGLKQARRFSWDSTARSALHAMETLRVKSARKSAAVYLDERRPKLAYVSPLPPERSGISDYSAELLPELSRHYEIEVIVSQETVSDSWVQGNAPIRSVDWFKRHGDRYDRVLYHFGNSPFHRHMFPLLAEYEGIVVLHDFFLANVLAEMEREDPDSHDWTMALYRSHGYAGLMQRFLDQSDKEVVWSYPCNLDVLQGAYGAIVHSERSKRLAEEWYGPQAAEQIQVVPLPRLPPPQLDRKSIREDLGLAQEDFLVCSFGMLGPTKLNHRLLSAWMASSLANDPHCRMVFVGDDGSNDYGANLLAGIPEGCRRERISITGWTDRETYKQWLSVSNVGVQLRSLWRGETSAAVLDCMNYGLATIVNAVGSTSEVPQDAVWILDETFSDEALIDALETLRMDHTRRQRLANRAREVILRRHQPRACADRYVEAIEAFYASLGVLPLTRSISRIEPQLEDPDLHRIVTAIARNHPPRPGRKQLLIDLSMLVQRDARTGIQRVVRAILGEFLKSPPAGYSVEPVYAGSDAPGYRYARRFTSRFLNLDEDWAVDDEPVEPSPGDIFLGLDLQHLVVDAQKELLTQWRNCGVKVYFCVYDLLCIAFPEAFQPGWSDMHRKWLETITRYDGAICISRSVADELHDWLENSGQERIRNFRIGWFHLGADLDNSDPSRGLPDEAAEVFKILTARPSLLTVGTLEPRKGHAQTVSALEALWHEEVDVNLVIVGQEGWLVEDLVSKLRGHNELGRRLFWLNGISDEYLERIYKSCTCLIAASHGEGFGLPLIEAARAGLPIIARDVPVFREVARERAFYFRGERPGELAKALRVWLDLFSRDRHPKSAGITWLTWRQSAQWLKDIILEDKWSISVGPEERRSSRITTESESITVNDLPGKKGVAAREIAGNLRYLEDIIDFESGYERGPLSNKEILVYAPQKTGTVTLYFSLYNYLKPIKNWEKPEHYMLHNHDNETLVNTLQVPSEIEKSQLLNRLLVKDLLEYRRFRPGRAEVTTSFRDPLSRAISEVFEEFDQAITKDSPVGLDRVTFEMCYERLRRQLEEFQDRPHPLEEIEDGFFDQTTFNHGTKSCYADRGHYAILVLCLEHSSVWSSAFETHFGYCGMEFIPLNVTAEKKVCRLYESFKNSLELPRSVIQRIYFGDNHQQRVLRWFYTKDEIDDFYHKAVAYYGSRATRTVAWT